MADSKPVGSEQSNGGIPLLFVIWIVCLGGAVACYHFLPRPEGPNPGPTEGLYRALTILGLTGIAVFDAIVVGIKTFKRRRGLSVAAKSLGYSPFFFTTGSVGTFLQQLLTE